MRLCVAQSLYSGRSDARRRELPLVNLVLAPERQRQTSLPCFFPA